MRKPLGKVEELARLEAVGPVVFDVAEKLLLDLAIAVGQPLEHAVAFPRLVFARFKVRNSTWSQIGHTVAPQMRTLPISQNTRCQTRFVRRAPTRSLIFRSQGKSPERLV